MPVALRQTTWCPAATILSVSIEAMKLCTRSVLSVAALKCWTKYRTIFFRLPWMRAGRPMVSRVKGHSGGKLFGGRGLVGVEAVIGLEDLFRYQVVIVVKKLALLVHP